MSRKGQVWESVEDGIFLVLGEEGHPNDASFMILRLASLELGNVAFLPAYIFYASEIVGESESVWRRVA